MEKALSAVRTPFNVILHKLQKQFLTIYSDDSKNLSCSGENTNSNHDSMVEYAKSLCRQQLPSKYNEKENRNDNE